MTGEQKPGGLEVVAKVVSAFGDPEAFGEREIEVVADLARIPYETRLTPAEPAEARIRELVLERDSYRTSEGRYAGMLKLAEARATAAEAKLARAVEGLERIVHWRVEMTGTPVDTEAANAWALTFDAAATEASQTLAALQQEGE